MVISNKYGNQVIKFDCKTGMFGVAHSLYFTACTERIASQTSSQLNLTGPIVLYFKMTKTLFKNKAF